MDVVTAITISYGSVIPPKLNILANTVYFALEFSLGYSFLRYVESYVNQIVSRIKSVRVNKIIYISLLGILGLNMFTGFLFSFSEVGEYIHGSLYLFTLYRSIIYSFQWWC